MPKTRTKPPRKRAPGAGRKPLPAGQRADVILQVNLPDNLKQFALRQGGSRWVRHWIQEQYIKSLIV